MTVEENSQVIDISPSSSLLDREGAENSNKPKYLLGVI